MKESPKEKSARIRRSLIHLPVALFANKNGKESLLTRILKRKGFLVGAAALVGAVGLATLVSSYKKNKEEDSKPGEETPDFEDEINSEKDDIPEKEVSLPSSTITAPVEKVQKPATSLSATIQTPIREESWTDKLKKLFSSEKSTEPVLQKGVVFQSKLQSSKLSDDYRYKFEFSNFRGSESISRLGAFTKDEADTIISLKKRGINTSANAGGMSKDIEERIRFFSKKHGLNEDIGLKMAQMESGGNPNAISATGAIGVFQFTGRTASEMGIFNRFDPDQNIEAGILLAKRNVKKLEDSSLEITAINIYLMHQLGVSGARELIKAAAKNKSISSLSKNTQRAIKHNFKGKKVKTAREYLQNTEQALTARSSSDKFASSVEVAPPVSSKLESGNARLAIPSASTSPVVERVVTPEAPNQPHVAEDNTTPDNQQYVSQRPAPVDRMDEMPNGVMKSKHGIMIAV